MDAEGVSTQSSVPNWLKLIFGRNPTLTLLRIVILTVISIIVFKFILLPIRVTGDSMFPTYKDRQIRFVNRWSYFRAAPQRGDVVAVEFQGRDVLLLKRIVGLPGESFQVVKGEVFINGEKLSEPYAHGKIPTPEGKGLGSMEEVLRLGPTEFMVIGDNRIVSEGFIKDVQNIIGKVL